MKIAFSKNFVKDYRRHPTDIQKIADKQLGLLLSNTKHPSLKIKKMNDPRNIWEGRVTDSYRFTFQIEGDTFVMRKIGTHDVLTNP